MGINAEYIYEFLREARTYGTRKPDYNKDFIKCIGADTWTNKQILSFYDFILNRYLKNKKLFHLRAVSGISEDYDSMRTAEERRLEYLKSIGVNAEASEAFRKEEDKTLHEISEKLQDEIKEGKLPKLIELWKAETIEESEPLPGVQDSSDKSETQSSSVESDEQGSGVQPEIHISNNANVSPTISNTVTNDNNITVQVHNIIHTETSSSSTSMNISTPNEERKISKLLTNKKRKVIILLIGFLAVVLFCWLLFSKSDLPSVDDIFVSEEKVSLRPGEIYEIKPAVLPVEAQSTKLSFVSLDTDVAKVSEKGIVVAQNKPGTCEIIIQAKSGATSKIFVTVQPPNGTMLLSEVTDENNFVPEFTLDVKVRNTNVPDNVWEKSVDAAFGDTIEFLISYDNISNNRHKNILIRDILPKNMTYVPNSTKFYDSDHENGIYLETDTITAEGISIDYCEANSSVSITFLAKISNSNITNTPILVSNWVQAQTGLEKQVSLQDTVRVNVYFWGPERLVYTMAEPAHSAVFNSITDNAAVGDERDFVRIAEVNSGEAFTSSLELEPNKEYIVFIYFHNNASATFNDSAYDNVGVAWNVRVSSSFPDMLTKGERGIVTGRLTSTNTNPQVIWDGAYIVAKEAMTLHFIPASARIHVDQKWPMNGAGLSTNLFSQKGTFLGLNELNGTIPGCDEYAGEVFYRIRTEAIEDAGVE